MEPAADQKAKALHPAFTRILYGGFLLFGIYYAVRQSFGDSFSMVAIALLFDPFDQTRAFSERPRYQRVWLFVHVGIMLAIGAVALTKLL